MRPIKASKLLFRIAFIALFGCLGWTVLITTPALPGLGSRRRKHDHGPKQSSPELARRRPSADERRTQ